MTILFLALLAACNDYGVVDHDTGPGEPEEVCDGLDSDGDGFTDDGFPDTDGDGLADCVDGHCELDPPEAEAVVIHQGCYSAPEPVREPWEASVEWAWRGLGERDQVLHTPVVGSLTDDDLDGDVDGDDVPEVVAIAFAAGHEKEGTLVVLDGGTGELIWSVEGFAPQSSPAVADVDADGLSEVLAFGEDGLLRALSADGEVEWTSTDASTADRPVVTVADLDGDGAPEVVADTLVLDGATGQTLVQLTLFGDPGWRMPAVADLDLDGEQEISISTSVFYADGSEAWSAPLGGGQSVWTLFAQADWDSEAELVMVGTSLLAVYEADGTEVLQVAAGGDEVGPPCAADLDGDGLTEVAWGNLTDLLAYDLDGTRLWKAEVQDRSGRAGCSAADLDADGDWEVLFADHDALYIVDGRSGEILATYTDHASGTIMEYPVPADVDGDGSMEILVASSGSTGEWGAITLLGHTRGQWMRGPVTWHEHDFAGTDILPGGGVPTHPEPVWSTWGTYRAATSPEDALPDLRPILADSCAASCDEGGVVRILVRVVNEGLAPSGPYVPVALQKSGQTVALRHLTDSVLPGETVEVELVVDAALVEVGMRVVVDGDDGEWECEEGDNTVGWDFPCL